MNILYGVQATGNGHISRSREVVGALKEAGHSVFVIFSGRDASQLWNVELFEPYAVYAGMTFCYAHGKIKYFSTLKQLSPVRLYRDIVSFNAHSFDLTITDFEPLSARIARRKRIPSIGIGHQYAFRYNIPMAKKDPLARIVLRRFAPADHALGLHWHHFNEPILPPILPPIDEVCRRPDPAKILVYFPFESPRDVLQLLVPFRRWRFHYYGDFPDRVEHGHILLCPHSRSRFLADLQTCSGVMTNAGFELPSETLRLGRKLLVKPLAGQFEQETNACTLEQLRLAAVMRRLDPRAVRTWLEAPQPDPIRYPRIGRFIADWVVQDRWDEVQEAVASVWDQVAAETGGIPF